ncbi:MAG: type II toxin-antitoxin system VapC family toxin [Gammaproteobacteria bacterium]|nr:type II toxin-antitoxin system VapC family toxin [Gammaproteobacteria bacterium]MDH5803407.1 type II toxin-antitoxin system VapC family toxin [Gammaproteobacteria bacterium]
MYLIDTNVISEIRKKQKANKGVRRYFDSVINSEDKLYISVVSIGELRRGIELIRHRSDIRQAKQLEKWLQVILENYQNNILDINEDIAQLWGKLRVPHPENALDKLIAATALINGLTVVTRNTKDFSKTGVTVLNPFEE